MRKERLLPGHLVEYFINKAKVVVLYIRGNSRAKCITTRKKLCSRRKLPAVISYVGYHPAWVFNCYQNSRMGAFQSASVSFELKPK